VIFVLLDRHFYCSGKGFEYSFNFMVFVGTFSFYIKIALGGISK